MRTCGCGCGRPLVPYKYGGVAKGYPRFAFDCDRKARGHLATTAKDTDLAWAAGIVDGEGCIHIKMQADKRRGTNRHVLVVSVVNTDPRMVQRLHDVFGGYVGLGNKPSGRRRRRFVWIAQAWGAAAFLQAISPYIVSKQDQVEVALLFAQTMSGRKLIPPEVIEERARLHQRLKDLHHRDWEGDYDRIFGKKQPVPEA